MSRKEERKVDVVIGGKVISLISGEEEAHLQRVARYVDAKIEEMKDVNSASMIDERVRTLLLALNISDDYYKAADRLARLDVEQEKYITENGRLQQENMLLTEQYEALQTEYARLKAEHEEYLEVFGSAKEENNVVQLNRKVGYR